jgi:hypothetical protein
MGNGVPRKQAVWGRKNIVAKGDVSKTEGESAKAKLALKWETIICLSYLLFVSECRVVDIEIADVRALPI